MKRLLCFYSKFQTITNLLAFEANQECCQFWCQTENNRWIVKFYMKSSRFIVHNLLAISFFLSKSTEIKLNNLLILVDSFVFQYYEFIYSLHIEWLNTVICNRYIEIEFKLNLT